MYLNKVTIMGRLGKIYPSKNPEVCAISVATNKSWKDKQSGEWKQQAEWHRINCFKHNAQTALAAKVGDFLYIEGSIQTNKYFDKNGVEKESKDIVCFILKNDYREPRKQKEANGNVVDEYENVDEYVERQDKVDSKPDLLEDDIPF